MLGFVNHKLPCCLAVFLWLVSIPAFAGSFSAEVKSAKIIQEAGNYLLSADITYKLSPKAIEALQNGVSLYWTLKIKIKQQRALLWDKTVLEKNIPYRIQYHALLNMYRVRNEISGEVNNFSTLSAALDLMSTLRNYPLINKAGIAPERHYNVALKVSFDRAVLPLPLRPLSYINPQWYLSSDWTLWPFEK